MNSKKLFKETSSENKAEERERKFKEMGKVGAKARIRNLDKIFEQNLQQEMTREKRDSFFSSEQKNNNSQLATNTNQQQESNSQPSVDTSQQETKLGPKS